MALFADDPGHVVLRRAVRAAVALPISLGVALLLLDDSDGALFAVLGTIGLLVQADFAGRPAQRLTAYLTTGVVGSIVLTIGWAAAGITWVATLVTLVLTFALGFTAFLRGGVAVGTPAVMLVFVVAITSDGDPGNIGQYQLGWWCAVVIATVTALALLPRDSHAGVRESLAAVFDAAADAVRATWRQSDPQAASAATAALAQRLAALDAEYGGHRDVLPGLAAHDQALDTIVAHLDNTRQLLAGTPAGPPSPATAEGEALADALVAALRDLARAMRDPSFLPTAQRLDDARGDVRAQLGAWVVDTIAAGTTPNEAATRLAAQNPLRIAAVLTEQLIEAARVANRGAVEALDHQPPVPTRTWRRLLRAQLSWRSAWTRHAARRALGLTLAVLVVDLVGVDHGFWVLLGTISVLRFDASGTGSLAWRAIAATAVGAGAAVALLLAFTNAPDLLWLLLPIATFLAAWAGSALGFAAGQAAFTAMVLIAVGVIHWPEPPSLALVRLEDVMVGTAVALVVAGLMWPRGAVAAVRLRLAESTRLASAYLSRAVGSYVEMDDTVESARLDATMAVDRAVETIEMARVQHVAAGDVRAWTRQLTAPYVLITAGRVVAALAPLYRQLPRSAVLDTALATTRTASDRHWAVVAAADRTGAAAPAVPTVPDLAGAELTGLQVAGVDQAYAFVLAAWAVDWTAFVGRLSPVAPLPASTTPR